ncbi:MAG: hypothetical protein ACTSPW_15890 [Promethearchaeota archaeon]
MNYKIKRIEEEDNIADLTLGFALILPYQYDILFGLTDQKSGAETFRFCKYNPFREKILSRSNIDFAKEDVKVELLVKIVGALEEILSKYDSISDILQTHVLHFHDSSLKSNTDCNLVYSVCYYRDSRHFGFCFKSDEYENPIFRLFRVDTIANDSYPILMRKDYYSAHRWIDISFNDLQYYEFFKALIEIFYEILEILEEGEPYFDSYPKYKNNNVYLFDDM